MTSTGHFLQPYPRHHQLQPQPRHLRPCWFHPSYGLNSRSKQDKSMCLIHSPASVLISSRFALSGVDKHFHGSGAKGDSAHLEQLRHDRIQITNRYTPPTTRSNQFSILCNLFSRPSLTHQLFFARETANSPLLEPVQTSLSRPLFSASSLPLPTEPSPPPQ